MCSERCYMANSSEVNIVTEDDFRYFVENATQIEGYRSPLAFGIGIANLSASGEVLDTFFPVPNYQANLGTAAVFSTVLGHYSGTATYQLELSQKEEILNYFKPFFNDGKRHVNIEAIQNLFFVLESFLKKHGEGKAVVVSFIDQPDYDSGPKTVSDAYLRLHLLSHRLVKPNGINLEGIFSKLPNNVWTNEGPVSLGDFPFRQLKAMASRSPLQVIGVDKFPRMTNYVVPSGVRIADASRIRLGAYLGEGTTVMHEGFCNFNAGTLGVSMVEGRISAGVLLGDQSDIGGGASIMGTLSGGGKEKISIGRNCLLGANSGTGISLGDHCVVEAGLYVTSGMPVLYEGSIVKAYTLSGKEGLTFRRNGSTGRVEVLLRPNFLELNECLHKN